MSKSGAIIKPPNLFNEIIIKLLIYINSELNKTYSNNDPKTNLVSVIAVECCDKYKRQLVHCRFVSTV